MKKDETPLKFEHEFDEFEPTDNIDILRRLKSAAPAASQEMPLRIVVIALGQRLFGIRIFSVREILKVPKMTWLPCVPEYIAGVIAIRGEVQAVVDLKQLLHADGGDVTPQSRIVLVESGELTAGLMVDDMLDILELPEQAILPLAESGSPAAETYFDGNIDWNGRMISLLNIETILQGIVIDQA